MSNDILRAAAMFECENAMARHCYHHARGTHRDELEEIWFSDHSRHHWKMMKSVMKSYVEGQENAAKAGYYRRMRTHPEAAIRCHDYRYLEEISVHVLSTPVIKASSAPRSGPSGLRRVMWRPRFRTTYIGSSTVPSGCGSAIRWISIRTRTGSTGSATSTTSWTPVFPLTCTDGQTTTPGTRNWSASSIPMRDREDLLREMTPRTL